MQLSSFWIVAIAVSLNCAACVEESPVSGPFLAPIEPKSQGPKIVAASEVDWQSLSRIVSIKLSLRRVKTHVNEYTLEDSPPKVETTVNNEDREIELLFFPKDKWIAFDPFLGIGYGCNVRGQYHGFQMIASPGAKVSDAINCESQFVHDRYRNRYSFTSQSDYKAGVLTIDGSADVHQVELDNSDHVIPRANTSRSIKVQGSIRILGTSCRVETWNHVHEEYEKGRRRLIAMPEEYDYSDHYTWATAVTAATRCTVELERN